jgi:hypothetical protein
MQEGQQKGAQALNPIAPLTPPRHPVRLAIGALVNEIKSWPKSGLPWIPDSWVLQSSLRGFVWRYERWADFNQEILAVALVDQ